MTDPSSTVGEHRAEIPQFPMPRAAACPFDPPPGLRTEQREGPLARVRQWDGSTAWLVTRHAELRALLGDPRLSADVTRPGFPHQVPVSGGRSSSFAQMDDPEHARLRRMVQAPFTVRRTEARRAAVQGVVDGLIDAMLASSAPADLVEAFALPVPSLVICGLLGVPYDEHAFFRDTAAVMPRHDTSREDRVAAMRRLHAYLDDLMGRKLAQRADDLLSGLVGPVRAGELTRAEAVELGVLLLFAGYETTANMIALGTLALLRHPDQLAELRDSADPALAASATEELLRHLNVIHAGVRRVALEDITIAGEVIRAGDGVILAVNIADRDPGAHPGDPDRLDIRRDARRHVAFGHGVHQCLGMPLARVELQTVFGTLFRRIPTLRLAIEPDQIHFKTDGVIYGVYELPVAW